MKFKSSDLKPSTLIRCSLTAAGDRCHRNGDKSRLSRASTDKDDHLLKSLLQTATDSCYHSARRSTSAPSDGCRSTARTTARGSPRKESTPFRKTGNGLVTALGSRVSMGDGDHLPPVVLEYHDLQTDPARQLDRFRSGSGATLSRFHCAALCIRNSKNILCWRQLNEIEIGDEIEHSIAVESGTGTTTESGTGDGNERYIDREETDPVDLVRRPRGASF
ncbi:hypothetical protein EVAR_8002_1 [Eumeta japonica]|uniref:Uncharacterized protein n=1 Tax=Eumeta variegata TaxID=151549 RepID=A0A4C1TK77_EUMVA|nr:hypothetical protein EVAR_8002_1 [Eumeta japonica]